MTSDSPEYGSTRIINARITFDEANIDYLSRFAKKELEKMHTIATKTLPMANEYFILKTCNRVELYCAAPDHIQVEAFKQFFRELANPLIIDERDLDPLITVSYDDNAITHLFRVAAGIESMAIGENEILGQIRRALELARNLDQVTTVLDHYVDCALKCGKKIRAITNISKGNLSLGSLALDFALKQTDEKRDSRILIIGAGEVAHLVLKYLRSHSHGSLFVCNRTYDKAIELASQFDGVAIAWTQLQEFLSEINILVCASGATDYVITEQMICSQRKNNLTIIDLGTPQNVSPGVARLSNVEVINMDTLRELSKKNLHRRQAEITRITHLLKEEIEKSKKRTGTLSVEPLIRTIYQKANYIRENELERMYVELENQSENEQKKIMKQFSQVLVKKILHDFITTMREIGLSQDKETIESLYKAFNPKIIVNSDNTFELSGINPHLRISSSRSWD